MKIVQVQKLLFPDLHPPEAFQTLGTSLLQLHGHTKVNVTSGGRHPTSDPLRTSLVPLRTFDSTTKCALLNDHYEIRGHQKI